MSGLNAPFTLESNIPSILPTSMMQSPNPIVKNNKLPPTSKSTLNKPPKSPSKYSPKKKLGKLPPAYTS